MRFEPRRALAFLVVAGLFGGLMALPAVSWVGTFLTPSQPRPSRSPAPALLREAIWARANGGRATALQPVNPFTLGRLFSCLIIAEQNPPGPERDQQHDACMHHLPAIEAVGYLATVQMRGDGVWQDVRVPFVQLSMVSRITNTWSKMELLDTLAERGEFAAGFVGAEAAARGFFHRPVSELDLSRVALLGSLLGDRRLDPWCRPEAAAARRQLILERMRQNDAIDDAALTAASTAPLGLAEPPAEHVCK